VTGSGRLRIPNKLSPEAFVASFWQKDPLFMPGGLDVISPSLDSGGLAWLATQEDVESRLVLTQDTGDDSKFEVRHGPFQNEELSSLPPRNWTLLVQDVEKHLPELRVLFDLVDFIPDWRIDDLMVSYAAPGGSVGPHRDNYDVFLCQGEGRREWHVGTSDEVVPDTSADELSLLRPFVDQAPRTASDGDVLYLPPGIPHWGIAKDPCMTYSIGMRAPNLAELNACAARLFNNSDDVNSQVSATDSDVFYEDPDLTIDEAEPGLISTAAIQRAKKTLRNRAPLDDLQVARILGSCVTDPKAWLAPECVTDEEAQSIIDALDRDTKLSVHGMARIAYSHDGGKRLLFANGHMREVSPGGLELFRDICKLRAAPVDAICADDDAGLALWLLSRGVFDLTGLEG
jgi:50S ribosomal protein L16 3-hydroxylase